MRSKRKAAEAAVAGAGAGAGGATLRVDKWLWQARFYKTRALATAAVGAGRVAVNGERVKASRTVKAGDRIAVSGGGRTVEVDVLGVPNRRGPAAEARLAYTETAKSIARGLVHASNQRLGAIAVPRPDGKPDKKARRQLLALDRRQRDGGGGEDEFAWLWDVNESGAADGDAP